MRHTWVDLLKVDTIQVVLLDEIDAGLDEGCTVLLGTKIGGEILTSSPTTN
jgi:hypothetical protein